MCISLRPMERRISIHCTVAMHQVLASPCEDEQLFVQASGEELLPEPPHNLRILSQLFPMQLSKEGHLLLLFYSSAILIFNPL